jgi:uncharacterized protein YggU (UPF0235/DUF167 family)
MTNSSNAVRFMAASKKSLFGSLQLQLHVKPGARGNREGIVGVTDRSIELCVAAQAKDGEANKAVLGLLSEILGVHKSRLRLSHGMKSRDKVAVLEGVDRDGEEYATSVVEKLRQASSS